MNNTDFWIKTPIFGLRSSLFEPKTNLVHRVSLLRKINNMKLYNVSNIFWKFKYWWRYEWLKFCIYYFRGRNFRGQKLSRFRGFWPFPRKFMYANFFNFVIRESYVRETFEY